MFRYYHTIRALYDSGPQKFVDVKGWVQSVRQLKRIAFIDLRDGSSTRTLKIAVPLGEQSVTDHIKNLKSGQCIAVSQALWVATPQREQPFELKIENADKNIKILGNITSQYPLQKKSHSLSFLRTLPYLKHRSNYLGSLLRFRSHVETSFLQFFAQHNFTKVTPPLITANDCEGGGELFKIDESAAFFGRSAYLTVSTQLHLEVLSLAISRCYALTPCFRAEKSDTNRHLCEFWMLEAEWCFLQDINELTNFTQNMLKSVVRSCYDNRSTLLPPTIPQESDQTSTIIQRWEKLLKIENWPSITYTEAIRILRDQHLNNSPFPNYEPKWGSALQSEHEKWLAGEYFKSPVFVTDYPKDCKAFYMKLNNDGQTVACFDLLVPGMGEIVGGSIREENETKLLQEMNRRNMNRNGELDWYVALRQEGSAPHGGFGLGVERLVSYLYGNHNIRDAIPFHRAAEGTIEL